MNPKTTDENGVAEFIIECETDTQLQVLMADYESASVDVKGTSEEEVSVDIALNPIDKIIQGDEVVLNPIYFDFDKSNITAQAAFELDKLIQVMNKYPELVIKAESHTDHLGSETYNQKLSERRALTTVQYVISKGIDESRISGEGKGGVAGFAKGGANVTLEENDDGTLLKYNVDAKIGGKLAQLGSRLIDSTSKKLAGKFFDNFVKNFEAKED